MKPTPRSLEGLRRKAVSADSVKAAPLQAERLLPLLIQHAVQGVSLVDWARHNRASIEERLLLAFHSRRPYQGSRKVLTGMAEAFRSRDLNVSPTQASPC